MSASYSRQADRHEPQRRSDTLRVIYAPATNQNSDMIFAIEDLIDEIGNTEGYDLSWKRARSQMAAEKRAAEAGPFDLLVTALEIPEDDRPSAGAGEQRRRGRVLIQRLRAVKPGLAAILITSQVEDDVFKFTQKEGVGLVGDGEGFAEELRANVIRYLGPYKPEALKPKRVDLTITLSTAREKGCHYQFQPEGQPAREVKWLTVDASTLTDWVDQSREVHIANSTWKGELKRLSDALAQELFEGASTNLQFRDEFNEWVGRVGIENIRVRFAVEDKLYPIAVEAFKRKKDEDYWMLKTAVYRGQEPRGDDQLKVRGLFQDEQTRNQPINFLIIQADVSRKVIVKDKENDLEVTLDTLPKLKEEVAELERLLADLKKEGRPIGEVRMIDREKVPAGKSFKEWVEAVLNEHAWHVVHYAGHAYYDSHHQVGYLFFPTGDVGLEPVRIDFFAYCLRRADTRFVFLSSCEGAQQDFIYHLAKERVPAIMGFLWNVGDDKAGAYAKSFYRHLLEAKQNERSLEYACLEAKIEMHAKHVDHPIWASPVLVMQA